MSDNDSRQPLDPRVEPLLLDRFAYDGREDDGYGPARPRIGDLAERRFDGTDQRVPFRIDREPITRLPHCVFRDGSWDSLLCTFLKNGPSCRIILVKRTPGVARIDPEIEETLAMDGRVYKTLTPDSEPISKVFAYRDDTGVSLVDWRDGRVLVDHAPDVETAFRRIGYRVES